MQVELIVETKGINPDFNRAAPQHRDTNWPLRTLPAGTVITGPDSYLLCLLRPPTAKPHDDEARVLVASKLQGRVAAPVHIQLPDAPTAPSSDTTIPADSVKPRAARAS